MVLERSGHPDLSTLILISRRVSIGKGRIVFILRSLTEGLTVCRKLREYCYRVKQKTQVRACISNIARNSKVSGNSEM